jgi:hypothetical protein
MQNLEKQKFEESWRSAFDGAEMTPSDSVWNGLEVRLASDESAVMKKRVVFYQRLAAALTVFALLSGTYAFFNTQQQGVNQITSSPTTEEQVNKSNANPDPTTSANNAVREKTNADQAVTPLAETTVSGNSNNDVAQNISPAITRKSNASKNDGSSSVSTLIAEPTPATIALIPVEEQMDEEVVVTDQTETKIAGLVVADSDIQPDDSVTIVTNQLETLLLSADQINAFAEEQHAKEKKEQPAAERMWLGMGAAAGSYNPGASLTNGAQSMDFMANHDPKFSVASLTQAPQSNQKKIGSAYSVGMAVGKRLGKRWVLQSGLNLLRQQLEYTSNFTELTSSNRQKSSVAEYFDASSSVSITTPYTVNSAMEIVSVPVQAGYMIVDRRVGWQMNAGVSQDFFIRNTLTDESGSSERFSQGAGSDSPYHSLNWSALFSTELSYRIGDHYRLSLVPGMRYSLRPMLKDTRDEGTPLVMDVGFRFKYLFN